MIKQNLTLGTTTSKKKKITARAAYMAILSVVLVVQTMCRYRTCPHQTLLTATL